MVLISATMKKRKRKENIAISFALAIVSMTKRVPLVIDRTHTHTRTRFYHSRDFPELFNCCYECVMVIDDGVARGETLGEL